MVRVFNALGHLVSVVADVDMQAGERQVVFNAMNSMPSGLYFYDVQIPGHRFQGTMTLVK